MSNSKLVLLSIILVAATRQAMPAQPVEPRQADGDGTIAISGELKQWHKVSLSLQGPYAHENDNQPNPFVDRCLRVKFTHESGTPSYSVPGYFAADGNAANSSAQSGTVWRAHLSPDKPGKWRYRVSFLEGPGISLEVDPSGKSLAPYDGKRGNSPSRLPTRTLPTFGQPVGWPMLASTTFVSRVRENIS